MVAAMNQRRTTLIIALVLALGAGWLLLSYLSNLQHQAQASGAPVRILVAAEQIPARVQITPAMLGIVTRPASAVDPNAITDPKQALGALSLVTIPAGAAVTASMIGHPSDVGLTVRLRPGMRAVNIQIDKIKGLAGLVQPGDRVDVIAEPPKQGPRPPHAATILRGIRVLAVGADLESASATPSPDEQNATTVTLEVTPKQADLLVMADLNTTLRLALRSPKEPINSEPTEALHFQSAGAAPGPVSAPPSTQAMADAALLKAITNPPAGAAAHAGTRTAYAPSSGVTIIDGDHYAGPDTGSSQ